MNDNNLRICAGCKFATPQANPNNTASWFCGCLSTSKQQSFELIAAVRMIDLNATWEICTQKNYEFNIPDKCPFFLEHALINEQ